VAVEGRAEADIERGLAAEVTGELERLVAEYPVRERLWRLLVLALYRAERQADALAAYRRARQLLAEELGIEPGEELRQLEEAVLRQEVPPPATAAVTRTLPRDIASFTGRAADLGWLLGDLAGASASRGVVGSARSAGWLGSARSPWRCARHTSSQSVSPPRAPPLRARNGRSAQLAKANPSATTRRILGRVCQQGARCHLDGM